MPSLLNKVEKTNGKSYIKYDFGRKYKKRKKYLYKILSQYTKCLWKIIVFLNIKLKT